jgi:glycosidase
VSPANLPPNHRLRCRSKWGDWILKETGAYGFRFDAVKHISQEFIAEFVKHIRSKESGRPKAFCVGEFWKGESALVSDDNTKRELTAQTRSTRWSSTLKDLALSSPALTRPCRVSRWAEYNAMRDDAEPIG